MKKNTYASIIPATREKISSEYMKYPKVGIVTGSTEKLEAQYICFLAKGISMGEYQNNGFVVTPTLEKGSTKSVHFPNLSYSKSFWTGINSNPNLNLSGKFSKTSIDYDS